jgi:hypothetical protein
VPFIHMSRALCLAGLISLGVSPPALYAQATLPALRASPASRVTQTIGFSEVTASFHRPGVKGRDVFGSVVPFGQMWRVGANENTTISFQSPVRINGQDVDAGTYGFHIIPFRDKAWTVVFSKQTDLWGDFGYDKSQDALRLEVVPQKTEHEERMNIAFTPIDDTTCTMSMRWADVSLPLELEIDLAASQFAATRALIEEKGADDPALLLSAAQWAVEQKEGLEDALGWIELAVAQKKTFTNLGVQAQLLEMLGRPDEAAPLKKEVWMVATEEDLSRVGGQLMSNRQYTEAIPIYKLNVRNSPKSWKAYDQLAEAYRKSGDKKAALNAYAKALDLVEEDGTRERIKKTVAELQGA